MQYNLIRNGYLTTISGTGFGNKTFTWEELEKLKNGNITSSGVSLTSVDVVYLEADLSNRIKIDGINLYTNNSGIANDVRFYYKNTPSDAYVLLSTSRTGTTYSTTIPAPSAPRYVVVVVSGTVCELFEYEIFNDDYIVAFGDDGSMYAKYIENAEVGEESPATTVPIYNNGTASMPVNAYLCVDWTDNIADKYVELSENVNGPWYAIMDGVLLENNDTSNSYTWNMGTFSSGVVVIDDKLTTSGTPITGVYTSPIFKLDDKYKASYFVVDATTESGVSNISYNENVYNGTIRVRSSFTEPEISNVVFLGYRQASNYSNIARMDINNGNYSYTFTSNFANSHYIPQATAVCRRTGRILYTGVLDYSPGYSYIYIFDRDGAQLYYVQRDGVGYSSNVGLEFDSANGFWGYSVPAYGYTFGGYTLYHYNSNLTNVLFYDAPGYDFCDDLAVEIDGEGVWYVNNSGSALVHLDSVGTSLASVILPSPVCVASISNGGCWVFDTSNRAFYKYSSDGTLLQTKNVDHSANIMTTDYEDGFWYFAVGNLYHVNSLGITTLSVNVGADVSHVKSGYGGCAVYSGTGLFIKWVDKDTATVARTFDISALSGTYKSFPGVFPIKYSSYKELNMDGAVYPRSDDVVWGTSGSLEWKEVVKDGYFLPKVNYHQVELTLHSVSGVPVVNGLIMAPAIKIQDIQAKSSKNAYVRSNVPSFGDIQDYDARLKSWWGLKDGS